MLSPDAMPESWRPKGKTQKSLSIHKPWSDSEASDAEYSIKKVLDEMIGHFSKNPSAVSEMWEDAVGALIEITYSSANKPAIDTVACDAAHRNLTTLIKPFLKRDPKSANCDDFEKLLPLAIYAHKFYPEKDPRTGAIVALTNAGYRDCGSLADAIDFDFKKQFSNKKLATETVFDLVI